MTSDQESLYKLLGLDSSLVTHHEDGTISYDGNVHWENMAFKVLPLKFRKVSGYFSCTNCTSLVSLKGAPQEVLEDFYCSGCTSLVSLEGGPQKIGGHFSCAGCTSLVSLEGAPRKVRDLDLEDTPVYNIPEDLAVTNVWLNGPNKYILADETRKVLQYFKSSIKSDDDAGEIILDRMNRPRWQIAYVTDYLNKELQK